jgi:hypothetical protein
MQSIHHALKAMVHETWVDPIELGTLLRDLSPTNKLSAGGMGDISIGFKEGKMMRRQFDDLRSVYHQTVKTLVQTL